MANDQQKGQPTGKAMGILAGVAAVWLVFVGAFSLGIWLYDQKRWPYETIQELKAFVEGNPDEGTSLAGKLRNDLRLAPDRHQVEPRLAFDRSRPTTPVEGLPLPAKRRAPEVFMGGSALPGYRLIHGTFAFENALHGVILLAPDGSLARVWEITQEDVPWNHRPDTNVVPHGIDIGSDGALYLAFDGGTSLRRQNWCGGIDWVTMGGFHHSVDLNGEGQLWTWGQVQHDSPFGRWMLKIDVETGEVLTRIRLEDVIKANPDIGIFSIRQQDTNTESIWLKDPWHANDLEALPTSLAGHYPDFEAGDLVASYRNIDLIFVMNPETMKVKWWRQGLVRRPHDPDFNARGTISIYDNNMHRDLSRIVDIDPVSFSHRTVVPGEENDFYSWRRGKHQELPDGGWLVTSTEQGRVFEVGPNGDIRFEFLNLLSDRKLLTVAEAIWLPEDFFQNVPDCSTPNRTPIDTAFTGGA